MSDDNNLFDDHDALDYILCEGANKQPSNRGTGCFGMIVMLILPLTGIGYLIFLNGE